MKILLDTHIALWAISDVSKIKDEIRNMIEDRSNEVYY